MGQRPRGCVLDAVRRWGARTVVRPLGERLARIVRAEVERVVRDAEFRARRDLLAVGERDAALSSAKFAQRTMPTAREFHDPIATLQYALDLAPSGGMALEFGVFRGRSLTVIAETRKGRGVFGFDSF